LRLKILKKLRIANLNSEFTGSYSEFTGSYKKVYLHFSLSKIFFGGGWRGDVKKEKR